MRTPVVVANWKMNTSLAEARALARSIADGLSEVAGLEAAICPPAPWLTDLAGLLQGSRLALGAQNMYFEAHGAFTGEVSPAMLKGLCQYVLIGQYERRILFHETEWLVKRKLQSALQHGLRPLLCIGDTADQREEGMAPAILAQQLESAVEDAAIDGNLVIAYDPAWTTMGRVMPPPAEYVNDLCGHIRETLAMLASPALASAVRIIYGGSVAARNIDGLAGQPEVDGALVGAASLNAANFLSVAHSYARRATAQS